MCLSMYVFPDPFRPLVRFQFPLVVCEYIHPLLLYRFQSQNFHGFPSAAQSQTPPPPPCAVRHPLSTHSRAQRPPLFFRPVYRCGSHPFDRQHFFCCLAINRSISFHMPVVFRQCQRVDVETCSSLLRSFFVCVCVFLYTTARVITRLLSFPLQVSIFLKFFSLLVNYKIQDISTTCEN